MKITGKVNLKKEVKMRRLAVCLTLFIGLSTVYSESRVRITAEQVYVLDKPSGEEVVAQVKKGQAFPLKEKKEYWYEIVLPDEKTGWIHSSTGKIEEIGDLRIPEPGNKQILTTRDGSTLMGTIKSIKGDTVLFESSIGVMTISVDNIQNIKEIPASAIRDGKYWFPDPNYTRLFFAPTGRTVKKGRGYFADYYLFLTFITYGLTDYLTLSGGISLFPTFDPTLQLWYIAPKARLVRYSKFDLSAGVLFTKVPAATEMPLLGIAYGVGTWGDTDKSLTLGAGYGFAGSELAEKPMVMAGGDFRISRRTKLLTENWIIPGLDFPLSTLGIRFFGESLAIDLGVVIWIYKDYYDQRTHTFPFPWVDFVINF